jgi:anti-sigma regulatory factor (Ser/Thr protein kinase)
MLIDAVGREETDPELLERLYSIDHIAVRLQRNADSLMLLAGIRETGAEAWPTPLANVIRASLGQIEGYQRVSLRPETEVTVAPDIVGDLTLMLAELLENAVAFSPSHTPVEVAVRPGTDVTEDGGALIEVIDHGLGMSAERLAEENARLVRRERLDLVPTRVLGLFAVGSLARRWGVRVSLSRTPGGGVTATVRIPASLLLTMSPEDREDAEQPVDVKQPADAEQPVDMDRIGAVDTGPIGAVAALPVRTGQETAAPAASRVPVSGTGATERSAAPSSHDALPRRLPTTRTAAGSATADRTVEDVGGERSATAGERRAADDSRPLRRRVRGATLARTSSRADRGAPTVRQPADAEAVRSELDEFEAAVRRAERDSAHARTEPAPSHHQQSQKESGSDHVDS